MIRLLRAPPFATVQDRGRVGYRHAAVPPSGAMDPSALELANALVGNPAGAAAIEWGIGAGQLRFEADTILALAGAEVEATIGDRTAAGGTALRAGVGDVLSIERLTCGAWLYVAVAGGIDMPVVLGSRSTYLPGAFGGMEGRLLRTGDVLPVGEPSGRQRSPARGRRGPADRTAFAGPVALLPGPERRMVSDDVWRRLLDSEWIVSRAVSRAGYRLEGPRLEADAPDDLRSAPVCPGTVQLPPRGAPIVLMPDGPTVGGYPRIAVVASRDLGRLAQRSPGQVVRFRP